MTIVNDVKGKAYEKLICYAMENSDAVMLVSVDMPSAIETAEQRKVKSQKIVPLFEVTDEIMENWRGVEQRSRQDATVFEEKCQPFLKELFPFLIKQRHDTQWPSTQILSCNSAYTISVYRVCDQLYPLLLEPSSYLSWRYPRYPEDLSFFKNGRCWLYASSHEGYIEFLPRTKEEYDFVCSLGIVIDEPYYPILDDVFYREEYTL